MARVAEINSGYAPLYVVWELTLKCDLACKHCGSRAGKVRPAELSLDEALEVVRQLEALGTREVAFIGGEAYLYPQWLEVVKAVAAAGIRASMTSGGRAINAPMAQAAAASGMSAISVSVDGLEASHDQLRGVKGSFAAAFRSLAHIRDAGMVPYSNTQINRLNMDEVEGVANSLFDAGVKVWQVQLTGPMGRAADRPDWLLQPYQMLELMPRLAAIARAGKKRGCSVAASNNLGYFGPYEEILRASHWKGCVAGKYVMGIEANGDIKGCPSLPSAPYVGGNVRERSIADLYHHTQELTFARDRTVEELWGFCRTCYYAEECRGGCSWTSHTLLGRRGNMPYCHHRALELKQQGKRERLVQVEKAPGKPFDFGKFELIEEEWVEELTGKGA